MARDGHQISPVALPEALNREIVKVDGTLPQIRKSRGTVGAYDISNSTYDALMRVFP